MKKTLLIILTVVSSVVGLFSLLVGCTGFTEGSAPIVAVFLVLLGVFLILLPIRAWIKNRKKHPRPAKSKKTFDSSNYFVPAGSTRSQGTAELLSSITEQPPLPEPQEVVDGEIQFADDHSSSQSDEFHIPQGAHEPSRSKSNGIPHSYTPSELDILAEVEEIAAWSGYKKAETLDPLFPLAMDEMLPEAVDFVLSQHCASVAAIQQHLKIGYSKAARIIDQMEELGLVGPYAGSKPRPVLVSREHWINIKHHLFFEYDGIQDVHTPPQPDIMEEIAEIREIKKLEEVFQTFYTYAQRKMLNSHEGTLLFKQIKDSFHPEEHLLPVQLRFEQLCEEYAPKFETPNPWLNIDSMKGQEFEVWCADILRESGFLDIEMTPGSGDQGVDILAQKSGIKYAIQCKRYSNDLGNTPIQEVNAGKMFYHCHVGVVMTNRHFTKGAKEMAEATGTLLWDRDYLQAMLDAISHNNESWANQSPQNHN